MKLYLRLACVHAKATNYIYGATMSLLFTIVAEQLITCVISVLGYNM